MLTILALHGSGRDETDLSEFCHQLAPQARIIAPRGTFAQADGFTFFKRRSDRSIIVTEVLDLATKWVSQEVEVDLPTSGEVIVVGYSSGAIFAEALMSVVPERFAGAVLMRPEPLSPNFSFPDMPAKPILIVAGKHDERRRHDDAAVLAKQFTQAGAVVSLHVIDAGHGWARHNADVTLARLWLATVAAN
ncbi:MULTISPECIES: alpha/beta hydrolase [unclassified Rhizobium]|uniref:alpha/beta hydrolase n=1 Tax=Rhizobium sp. PP-CC-3G-465 TaxID=2135648 RepID=UPI001049FA60|nr:phospholipase/carboxylesterase [Rhizobium sp. PP-CC-2G-626]TCQ27567.1 phospholipase/carboxylesterase [Rhizobium sp. PP-CC-3G-465]